MDKLKKIKPIYIEIFSLLLCNLCAINIIIDTLSYTLNQRLIYTIATLVLSLVLFYIKKVSTFSIFSHKSLNCRYILIL